ncbi:hypothetical protein ACPV4W_05030 [Vibrio diabolicus]|uniref:hypothetical protein n=1 Tax=Vibrio diabolicus TaxID=50719 RepID=UPI0040680DC9
MAATMSFVRDDVQVIDRKKVNKLVVLAQEKSYKMPSGLTREQRREWAKTTRRKAQ